MGYDELEYAILGLREVGIRRIYVNKERYKEPLLCVDTDNCYIGVTVSNYEQTRRDLEKELSLQMEDVRQIGVALEYFDEKWSEIEEFVSEKAIVEGGKVE